MANIKVKINDIDDSIDKLIEEALSKVKLPTCLGMQTPPLLYNEIDIEETEIVKINFEVEEENTYSVKDLNKTINSAIYSKDYKFAIMKSGIKKANELKQKMVDEYVAHLERCVHCKYTDICDKLTRHYRETVNIK